MLWHTIMLKITLMKGQIQLTFKHKMKGEISTT